MREKKCVIEGIDVWEAISLMGYFPRKVEDDDILRFRKNGKITAIFCDAWGIGRLHIYKD